MHTEYYTLQHKKSMAWVDKLEYREDEPEDMVSHFMQVQWIESHDYYVGTLQSNLIQRGDKYPIQRKTYGQRGTGKGLYEV